MGERRRLALVTGATKGIGWAISRKFAEGGTDLLISSRNLTDLEERKKQLSVDHPDVEVMIHACDLSERDGITSVVNFTLEADRPLDILINNAGVFLPGEVLKEPEGHLELQIKTNLYSAYHLTRGVLPKLEASQRGYIVNMCSVASIMAYPNGGSYSISKFAMLGWSKAVREELKDSRIAVTSVLPGATWSASWAGAELPRERIMEAENIANLCWQVVNLDPNAVVEEIIIRPQLGDL